MILKSFQKSSKTTIVYLSSYFVTKKSTQKTSKMYSQKLSRNLYKEVLDIVVNFEKKHFRRVFDLGLFAFELFRFSLHLYMFYWNFNVFQWWRYDYLAVTGFNYPANYNMVLCFIFFMIMLFGTVSQTHIYFSCTETLALQFFYDIVVRQTDIYLDCIKDEQKVKHLKMIKQRRFKEKLKKVCFFFRVFVPRRIVALICKYASSVSIWWNMEFVRLDMLMKQKLKYVPTLSLQSRTRLLVFLDLVETFYNKFPLMFCKFFI